MIHVVIDQDQAGRFVGFHTDGHADYQETGADIVCAAVSVLVINTVNAIDRYTVDSFSVEEEQESGRIDCRFDHPVSEQTDLLLKTMILGLTDMAHDEQYADYIDLTFQEVKEP